VQGSKHANTITLICESVACEKRITVVEFVKLETGGMISEVFEVGLDEFVAFMEGIVFGMVIFGTVAAIQLENDRFGKLTLLGQIVGASLIVLSVIIDDIMIYEK